MIILTRRRKGEKSKDNEVLEFGTFQQAKAAAFGYDHAWIRCDSCVMVSINGTACHETGCPGARAEKEDDDD